MNKYYSVADIFVITSHYENFPITVLEAMSCELPILAPRVGGIPLLVENGINGFLYEPGDINSFINGIDKIMSADRKRIGEINREKIFKKYNWERISEIIRNFYYEILKS